MKKMILPVISGIMVNPFVMSNVYANGEWKGSAELGLIFTSGNTETQSTNGKLNFENERDKWRHNINLEVLQIEDNKANTTTAERYTGQGKSAYKFTKLDYAFAELNGEKDKFSGYDYRASFVLGYGRRVLNKSDMRLDLEAGPGFRRNKPDTGDIVNEGVFQLSGKYQWDISKTTKFSEEASSQYGFDNGATISKSVTALTTQIDGNLAMKTTLTIRNTTDVPAGVKKTDTETAVTLVYNF